MAIKKTKTNVDPGKPVDRPQAPVTSDTGWNKMLSNSELLEILDRVYNKQKEKQDMSKLSDTLKAALDKKRGITHVDGSDVNTTVEKKAKVKTAPPTGKKPPTRSAGRGR
jgi:hypothetical protein